MTSKHCFFKVMREDFRHKIWMLALSVLGSMLALPVVFLFSTGDRRYYDVPAGGIESLTYQVYQIEDFFVGTMNVSCGIIAVTGAVIVGLFGFRYVFRQNMVDTYHSMPVRRRTLFAAGWLNGFLIWFLPFLAGVVITLIMGESRLSTLRNSAEMYGIDAAGREMMETWVTGGGLFLDALQSVLALAIAFLLVYHLVLLAVMLCGNVLNTLVASAVLGVGAISGYVLFLGFSSVYLDTFQSIVTYEGQVMYASPLISAIYVLYQRAMAVEEGGFALSAVLNLVIAAALGILSLAVYLRRPSELAEQGIANKPVKFLVQLITSVAAAMGGWILFDVLARSMMGRTAGLAWAVFGALLVGVVVFGVLDVIFHMDFKAFFAHKALMAAVMAASLLICFAFSFDWFGYDSYLPEEKDIAEISVYDYNRSNINYLNLDFEDEMHPLNQVHITDQTDAYAFLEASADNAEYGLSSEIIYVKVTLKSGRTYYRRYRVTDYNNDSVYTLLTSPEYLNANFRISSETKANVTGMSVSRNGMYYDLNPDMEKDREIIDRICDAYNKDIEEHPDAFIGGDGRLLARIALTNIGSYGGSQSRYLGVYEEMSNTREALRLLGLGEYADPMAAEDVEELRLGLNGLYWESDNRINLVERACEVYGVFPEEADRNVQEYDAPDLPADVESAVRTEGIEGEAAVELCITDTAEIEELLELISYAQLWQNNGVFRPEQVEAVTLLDKNGREYSVSILAGTLPEKYILRFGELQEALTEAEQNQ